MSALEHKPFAPTLTRGRARALPVVTVAASSLLTALPVVAAVPLLPPFGLLVLLAWRLLARHALRPWAAAPLGFVDDLVSGQPLGSAVLLWSVVFLGIATVEQRINYRDFWQDWVIAAGAIAFCLIGGRALATRIGAPVDAPVAAQLIAAVLLFPLAARYVAWLDRKRGLT